MPALEGRSKRYHVTAISELLPPAMPGLPAAQASVQVTARPVVSDPAAPAGQPVTWTFDGDEAIWAASFFDVGGEYENGWEVAEPAAPAA